MKKAVKHSGSARMQYMTDKPDIDSLVHKLLACLPADFSLIKQDVEKNFRSALMAAFSKMDLVTREEYDVQTALLKRTREKLEAMEQHLSTLEQQLRNKKPS